MLAFIKLRAAKLAEHRPGDGVLVTELGAEPLETLERLLADVYLPLLSNPANTEGWSDVVSHDVVDTLHAFLARVSIANGAARGETCLPLPPLDAPAAPAATHTGRYSREKCSRFCTDFKKMCAHKLRNALAFSMHIFTCTGWLASL